MMVRVLVVCLACGCSSSPDPSGDAAADVSSDVITTNDAGGDANDGGVGCTQVIAGDESQTLTCTFSLCHPQGETYEVLDLSSVNHIIRPQVNGAFAVGAYTATDLDVASVFSVTTSTKTYGAQCGPTPYAGQNVFVKVDSVTSPSKIPCDGQAHGTVDATLVELVDGGVGPGHVMVHVTF